MSIWDVQSIIKKNKRWWLLFQFCFSFLFNKKVEIVIPQSLLTITMRELLALCQLDIGPSSFTRVRRTSSLHKRMSKQVVQACSSTLKLESSKSEFIFFEWICACVPFSCFWRGFYRTYGVIVTTLIVHSCIFCSDDHHCGGYYALIR